MVSSTSITTSTVTLVDTESDSRREPEGTQLQYKCRTGLHRSTLSLARLENDIEFGAVVAILLAYFPLLSFPSFTASALHTSTASPHQISKNQHLSHTDWPPPQYLKVPRTLALGWLVGDEPFVFFFLVIIKESVPLASVLKLSSTLSLRVYAPLNDKHVYDEENYWSQYPSKQRVHASAHQLLTQLLYHYVLRGTHM